MPCVVELLRAWSSPRALALVVVAVSAAACSSESTRFNDNPFASRTQGEVTGSIPPGQAAPVGRVDATQLPPPTASKGDLAKLIDTQHAAVEAEVRERVSPEYVRRMKTRESQTERFNTLFDEGCNRYREADYAAALRDWEEALSLGLEDKALATNIRVARMKLATASSG